VSSEPGASLRRDRALATGLGTLAAGAWSAARNLHGAPVTFDEDEVGYFNFARATAELIYDLKPLRLVEQLVGTPRPPLVGLTDALTLLLLPAQPALLAFARVFWTALLLWQASGLAVDLLSNSGASERVQRRAAACAVGLLATAPLVLQLGSSLMYEVPLAAVAVVAVRELLRLGREPSRKAAVRAGLACGLGLLIKWTFPVAIVGPVLVLAVRALRAGRSLRPWFLAAGVALALAAPWYLATASRTLSFVLDVSTGEGARAYGAADRSALEEVGFYVPVLLGSLLWWPLAGAAFWGLFRAVRARVDGAFVLLAGVLAPPLLFSLLANKEVRYLLPMVPLLAAMGGVGLARVDGLRRGAVGALGVVALFSLGAGLPLQASQPVQAEDRSLGPIDVRWDPSAGVPAVPVDVRLATPLGPLVLWSRGDVGFFYRHGVPDDLPFDEIVGRAEETNPGGPRDAVVLSPETWIWTPLWTLALERRGWTAWRTSQCDAFIVGEAAYFLSVEPPGAPTVHCREIAERAAAGFEALRPDLQVLDRWSFEGRRLTLWVHRERLYANAHRAEEDP